VAGAGVLLGAALPHRHRRKFVSFAAAGAVLYAYRGVSRRVAPAHARSVDFWTRVVPIYAAYKFTQARTKRMKGGARQDEQWQSRHEWGAEAVYRLCVEMRGFYLKDGQFIGSRADFIPEEWGRKLELLQDRVPPVPFAQIERVLRQEMHVNDVRQLFRSVDENPLASATIAQVHRAVTKRGRKVVAKVQYEDQEGLVQLDLRNLRKLAAFLQANDMKFFDLVSVVSEFEAQMPLEFNFEEEARMMRTIGSNLRAAGISPAKVVVPELEESLASRRVLVMEFLQGVRFDRRDVLTRWGVDCESLVRSLGEAYGRMILVDGVFHADPHPGNLLVLPDGRVGLIDFGQCKRLAPDVRAKLCIFYLAVASGDPFAVAETFAQLGIELDLPADGDKAKSNYLVSIYANGLLDTGPLPDGIEINPFAEASPLRDVPISKFPSELFMVLRTMGLLRALCTAVGSQLAMSDVFRPYAAAGLRGTDAELRASLAVPASCMRPLAVQKTIMRLCNWRQKEG